MSENKNALLRALWKRAEAADQHDTPATAVELLKCYLRYNPHKDYAHFLLAENLRSIGRIADAEQALRRVKHVPPSKRWLVALCWAEIYARKGQNQEAEAAYRNATELNSDSTVPWVYFGCWLATQERFQDAVDILMQALKASGDLDEVYLNLGYNKRALRDYAGAKQCFEEAFRLTPSYEEAQAALQDVTTCLKAIEQIKLSKVKIIKRPS